MKRRNRIFAAWLAMLALLFAQLATAAYACPQLAQPLEMAMSADCDHEMAQAPNLCERHCDYGKASVDKVKNLAAPDVAAAAVRPLLFLPAVAEGPRMPARAGAATGPPLTRFTVLRI